ncbi:O-antigen ligase family protein [Mycolicibacterium aichiense]|uniref:O-antigen ligase family protein n=1 Tax=Mycolicibacterium aichiense TaxID=1799 RepID=UPI0013D2B205|nr:O-antigen ligase family protein [Mycolicibacterium aichiense]MCV7016386.1 O-antigen ligase family protein [Mycolicibacterium aichiense]
MTKNDSATLATKQGHRDGSEKRYFNAIVVSYMLLGTLPPFLQILSGERISIGRRDIDLHQTALASGSQVVMAIIVCAICGAAIIRKKPSPFELHLGSVGIALCLAGSIMASAYRDDSFAHLSFVVQLIVNMLLVMALFTLRIRRDDLVIFAHLGALIALLSLVVAALTDQAWMVGTLTAENTKGILTSGLLAGPYTSMNVLGMTLALALPFTALVKQVKLRWVYIGMMSFTLLLSACRSAMVGVAVAVGLGVVIGLFRLGREKRLLFWFASVGIVTTATMLPWLVEQGNVFSDRGNVWLLAKQAVLESPLMGQGFNFFGAESVVSDALGWQVNSAHNLFLNYWIIGGPLGIVGIYFLLFWVASNVFSLEPFDRSLASFVIILLTLTVVEMPFQLEKFIGLNWIAWPALISVGMVARTKRATIDRAYLRINVLQPPFEPQRAST